MHPVLGKAKKLYTSQFYQLKIRNSAIGTFLEQIKIIESTKYW